MISIPGVIYLKPSFDLPISKTYTMKLYNAQRVILNSNVRRVSTQEVANVTTRKYETARRPVSK